MIIEINEQEAKHLFGNSVIPGPGSVLTFSGGPKRWKIQNIQCDSRFDTWEGYKKNYEITLFPLITVKTPEELAAEEAVNKAEESLKAANKVLDRIRSKH